MSHSLKNNAVRYSHSVLFCRYSLWQVVTYPSSSLSLPLLLEWVVVVTELMPPWLMLLPREVREESGVAVGRPKEFIC